LLPKQELLAQPYPGHRQESRCQESPGRQNRQGPARRHAAAQRGAGRRHRPRPLRPRRGDEKLWDYIKAHKLQDPQDKRTIRADATLRPIFGADSVGMFKLAGIVGGHLS
jgi:hypothetical protein